jgi:hypothetical protein
MGVLGKEVARGERGKSEGFTFLSDTPWVITAKFGFELFGIAVWSEHKVGRCERRTCMRAQFVRMRSCGFVCSSVGLAKIGWDIAAGIRKENSFDSVGCWCVSCHFGVVA